MCFFIGVVTGAVAAFIDILIYYSGRVKFHYIISNCEFFTTENDYQWVFFIGVTYIGFLLSSGMPETLDS